MVRAKVRMRARDSVSRTLYMHIYVYAYVYVYIYVYTYIYPQLGAIVSARWRPPPLERRLHLRHEPAAYAVRTLLSR